jgi:hypothetical protein
MPVEPVVVRPTRAVPRWTFRAWELLGPRLPSAAVRVLGRFMLALPRGSQIRGWVSYVFAMVAWDATARTRFDLVLPIWDPDCEWHWDATLRALGFDAVYRGHDGVMRSLEAWNESWSERSFAVREILDGGSTWVMHTTFQGVGRGSRAPIEGEVYSVVRLAPLIVDFRNYGDEAEALREAGFA